MSKGKSGFPAGSSEEAWSMIEEAWSMAMPKYMKAIKDAWGKTPLKEKTRAEIDELVMKIVSLDLEEAEQWAAMAGRSIVDSERAKVLSEALHSATNFNALQAFINAVPVDALTLVHLVTLERNKKASALEAQISQRNRKGGLAYQANTRQAAIKPEVIEFFKTNAVLCPTKAAFVAEVVKKWPNTWEEPRTVAGWINQWIAAGTVTRPAHWRTRAATKRT